MDDFQEETSQEWVLTALVENINTVRFKSAVTRDMAESLFEDGDYEECKTVEVGVNRVLTVDKP